MKRRDRRFAAVFKSCRRVSLAAASYLFAGHVRAGEVAVLFNTHPRTLDRHLRRFDTTFKQLLDETRFEMARQLLKDSELSVSEISTALGYSRSSAFIRAFHRWRGITPGAWRTLQENVPAQIQSPHRDK